MRSLKFKVLFFLFFINILFLINIGLASLLHSKETSEINNEAQISISVGEASKKRAISNKRKLSKGMFVREGDILKTSKDGYIELLFVNGQRLRIYKDSEVLVQGIWDAGVKLTLYEGIIGILNSDGTDFTYDIEGPFFKLKSSIKDKGNDKSQESGLDESDTNTLYIEQVGKQKARLLHKSGFLLINANTLIKDIIPKTFKIQESGLYTLSAVKGIEKVDLKDYADYLEEYEDLNNIAFEESTGIDKYDPEYSTKIASDELFYKRLGELRTRKELIRAYRSKDNIYYNIHTTIFAYINKRFYGALGFYPEFHITKNILLRLRFLLYIPYSKDAASIANYYNIDEWDFEKANTYLNKIDLFSYEDDTFYLRISNIPEKTLSKGLLVKDYTNDLSYPQRRYSGLNIGIRSILIDIEAFFTDITKFKTMGFQVESRPFANPDDYKYKNHYTIGLSFSADIKNGLLNDNPSIYLGSIDIGIPILRDKRKNHELTFYTEIGIGGYELDNAAVAAEFNTTANKFHITKGFGLIAGFNSLIHKVFSYNINYRYLRSGFVNEYIDTFYDIFKENKLRELLDPTKKDKHGVNIGIGLHFKKYLSLHSEVYVEIANVSGEIKTKTNFKFALETSKDLIPLVKVKLLYIRKGITSPTDFVRGILKDSFVLFKTNVALTSYLDMIISYRHYVEVEKRFADLISINFVFII